MVFLVLCAAEGTVVAAATGRWVLLPAITGLGVLYFFVGREWGDAWLRRALRARRSAPPRLRRLAVSEARSAGVQEPDVLIAPGSAPNAIALALRRRAVVLTEGCEQMDELPLEAMVAHEMVHLRDGDAAVSCLYLVLAAGPQLLLRGAGLGCLLAVPLWPAAAAMRLMRPVAVPPDREHRADVAAAMLTRYPPGLVAALEAAGGRASGLRAADGLWFVPRERTRADALRRAELIAEM
jgi:heat shock protein HtpX